MLDQPMRTTRSMARFTDAVNLPETSSPSPRKARASQAAQLDQFDLDSPNVSMAPCMESPKKGRFDDFEFELENSIQEVPTRRRRIAGPRQSSASSSADVGLPRSKTSTALNLSTDTNTLQASRKENSPGAPKEEPKIGSSPIKPQAALPRPSRLHGPTPGSRAASREAATVTARSSSSVSQSSGTETKPVESTRDSNRLQFETSHATSEASVKRNPFHESAPTGNSLAMLGESRHSPVKRFQPKSELIIQSRDQPDRKPINLLDLKPSPGKASRGIFRHNAAYDEEDEADGWDESDTSNTMDEIKLVKGPAPNRDPRANKEMMPPSSDSSRSTASASSTKRRDDPSLTSTPDVKHTLSSETSTALAKLEASLAKLNAKTRSPPKAATTTMTKKEEINGDVSMKRGLGATKPPVSGITSSRTQIFRTRPALVSGDSSLSARSATHDQSGDSSVFKRPTGRISALAKSRASSSDLSSALNPSLATSKSMMSFGAPRIPDLSELSRRAAPPVLANSRKSSLTVTPDDSRLEEEAAAEEEQARIAEAKRQAELKAAKRKSMSSVLSSGMPPPLQRKERDSPTSHSTASTSKSSAATPVSPATTESTGESSESAEARKASKAARRRSLYTYVPPKRGEMDGERSIGNISTSLAISTNPSSTASGGDTATQPLRKTRFLRGLTVLVDVRDQDGEDASACWVEMLKNAGAKVMLRFGERKLTHIVYKSGRPNTLHSYRALDDPKPHVVGISWVVACLEQGKKVDETPYLVEVAKQAIFTHVSQTQRKSQAQSDEANQISYASLCAMVDADFVQQRRRSLVAPRQVSSSATSIRERE